MIAITGSGEYLEPIKMVDKELLKKLSTTPYVLTLSTAAGNESVSRLNYWKNLATEHFNSLGVEHKHLQALDRDDLNSKGVLNEMSKANFVYFSGGNPNHLYSSIEGSSFYNSMLEVENRGIIAGCSAGAMIMGEKMIKGPGLRLIKNSIIIPHYGESYYSWVANTVKLLNKGKYKLICLEKNTYFILSKNNIEIIGSQNVHIIYKDSHKTFSDGNQLETSILELDNVR